MLRQSVISMYLLAFGCKQSREAASRYQYTKLAHSEDFAFISCQRCFVI